MIKFPTWKGVDEEKGDQTITKNCYPTTLRPDGVGGQDHSIVDMDVQEDVKRRGKPVEDLVSTPLVFEEPEELPA